MKQIGFAIIAVLLLGTQWLSAADPVDNQVKGALSDIERYEKQFLGQTSANPNTVRRSLRLLNLTRQRLDGSPNKSHPSWVEADTRFNNLIAHLNRLLNPSSTASPAPQTSTAAPAQNSAPASAAPQQMISQYRVRIKKILRDINSRFDTMDNEGVKPFQDSEHVAKWEKSAAAFQASIAKYDAYKNDPDVVAATEALNKLINMINFGKQHAAKEMASLGDVQARLAAVEAQTRQLDLPSSPQAPYQKGQIHQWLVKLATARQAAADIYKPLPDIKQRAYLPDNRSTVQQGGDYDIKDIDRLERSLLGIVNSIDSSLKSFARDLDLVAQNTRDSLQRYSAYDPAKPHDQTNHFLSEGRADEVRAMLATEKLNISELVQFAELTKNASLQNLVAVRNETQSAIDQYEANYQKALGLIRMPEAASKDSKLMSIAKDALAKEEGAGNIKRMVINSNKQHHSMESSDQKFDKADVSASGTLTLSGTKTTYFYEWDQFQVATAEPVGDKHYIFYNTLKYYTSGDTTTTLNKWIVTNRIQGSEIPESSISK